MALCVLILFQCHSEIWNVNCSPGGRGLSQAYEAWLLRTEGQNSVQGVQGPAPAWQVTSVNMEATRQNFTSAYDHLLKILLVGDAKSNKRLLLGTYLEEAEMDQKSITTLGLDYKLKDVRYKGKIIKLQLWDTAGQERFRSVTASYYRGAHGALLCFAVEKDPSFLTLSYWLDEIRDNAPVNFQVVLVAIESSSEDADFNLEMVRQFAREKQLQLVTCNARDSAKVQEAFQILIEKIMATLTTDGVADSVRLHDYTFNSDQSRCAC